MKHEPIDPASANSPEASLPAAPAPAFQPVQLRHRRDGWTVERQIAFIEKLADTGSVTAACRHVGMSRESANQLRRHPNARSFRDAWEAAVDCSYAEVEESAAERSKHGVLRPIFYRGEQVGEWRHYDERMTMFLLRYRRARRFGPALDREGPPTDPDSADRNDAENQLLGHLDDIEFSPDSSAWDVDASPEEPTE